MVLEQGILTGCRRPFLLIDGIRTSFLKIESNKFPCFASLLALPYGLLLGSTYNEVSVIFFDAPQGDIKSHN
jgi:hypothetical protein